MILRKTLVLAVVLQGATLVYAQHPQQQQHTTTTVVQQQALPRHFTPPAMAPHQQNGVSVDTGNGTAGIGIKQVSQTQKQDAADKAAAADWPWKKYFPLGQTLLPLARMAESDEAYAVLDEARKPLGWVFRTDHIAPRVKGFIDQIGTMVALSKDLTILGIEVLQQRETPRYFAKLKEPFYKQFEGHRADKPFSDVDGVSGATFSSRAVIEDVRLSCLAVLKASGVPVDKLQGDKPQGDKAQEVKVKAAGVHGDAAHAPDAGGN